MSNCMPKEQREYIEKIQKDCLESTNMTESEAYSFAFRCWQMDYVKQSAEYKYLEEQGLLLKLPCQVGDTVWVIDTIYECDNDYMDCIMEFPDTYQCEREFKCEYEHEKLVVRPKSFDFKMLDNFNKTVFLTKEEAEQELKRLECAE